MKKTYIMSLILSVSLIGSAVVANASTKNNIEKIGVNIQTLTDTVAPESKAGSEAFQAIPTEISGTIEKIDNNEMIVKATDGKKYLVPLIPFSEKKEFKNLDLKVGTEVSLKRSDEKNNGKREIGTVSSADLLIEASGTGTVNKDSNIGAGEVANVKGKAVVDFEVSSNGADTPTSSNKKSGAIKIEEGMLFFIADEITANGNTVDVQ
ncbi:MAG: hypothetical protein AB6733_04830 [Clostridiaceae bacterium]